MGEPVVTYSGERAFVLQADCMDAFRVFPDNSIDSIVTDPPYGLGFMGKAWDDLPPSEEWARQCLRVLKPGGHLLAFGGTRTWHRLATAIEDAGFELRDSIAWLYGCLSDDTEILTSDGWVRYDRAKEGQHALALDTGSGEVEWQPIQRVHRYWHDGDMVRLTSDVTDQFLTLNHRVVLDEAESSPHTPYIPGEQDLRRLLERVPSPQPVPVGAEPDMLAGVCGQTDLAEQEGENQAAGRAQRTDGSLRDLRGGDVETGRLAEEDERDVLLTSVQRGAARRGVEGVRAQGARGVDAGIRDGAPGANDRQQQPLVERRRYRVQEAGELLRGPVRTLAGVGAADGASGRLRDGAPAPDGRAVRLPADPARSGAPRGPRAVEQHTGEPDSLAVEPVAQTLRVGPDGGGRILPSTPVTATRVGYVGVVWCITVPHGAFIARRNGLIFATGNSGFPKSLDVSKAIDKAAGAEREVLSEGKAVKRIIPGADQNKTGSWIKDNGRVFVSTETAPATPDAERWQGWGTALKPAFEPVVVARKPLVGTVAANVLAHGTGALNIDATRIGFANEADETESKKKNQHADFGSGPMNNEIYGKFTKDRDNYDPPGRWPANVVLDESQAEALDEQSGIRAPGNHPAKCGGERDESVYALGHTGTEGERRPTEAGGASRFFYCAKAPAKERPKVDGVAHHPTVKPLTLMRWLVRLVTPPGGKVLDTFVGSGTTIEAAILEGFEGIGIEKETEYASLIEQRIVRALTQVGETNVYGDEEGGPAA